MNKFIALAALATVAAANASSKLVLPVCDNAGAGEQEFAVILKGTIKDEARVYNYTGESCQSWVEDKRTIDVYMGICYVELDCDSCENTSHVNEDESFVVLVDKKNMWIEEISFEDIDFQLVCTTYANGKNDGAISMNFWIEEVGGGIVTTGKRDCKYGIKELNGFAIGSTYEEQCFGEISYSKVSLRRDDTLTKSLYSVDSEFCPNCSGVSCDALAETVENAVVKKYKDLDLYIGYDEYIYSLMPKNAE